MPGTRFAAEFKRGAKRLSAPYLALGAFLFLGIGAASGCSSEAECGGVEIDGKCYAACDDNQCVEGNRCVPEPTNRLNECRPACESQADCEVGTNCVNVAFSQEDKGRFCVPLLAGKTGQNEACAGRDECDHRRGFECVEGQCTQTCSANQDCADGALCSTGHRALAVDDAVNICKPGACESNNDCNIRPGFLCIGSECIQAECAEHSNCAGGLCTPGGEDVEGNSVTFCKAAPGEKRGPGEYGTLCPSGVSDCAEGFVCLGGGGEGNLYSYCTEFDCTQDSDCGTGFHCGRIRVGDAPCDGATCDGVAAASAGATCISSEKIGAGKQYECGALNLMRNACVKNEFCSSCETDADCMGVPGQICAKGPDGGKICTTPCDPQAGGCPWGGAAECKVFDTERGIATCGHRSGACRGTGGGCESCVDDNDCGATGVCLSSNFTGEKFCVDLAFECSCEGLPQLGSPSGACLGGGCPTTPGGLQMYCFGHLPASEENNPIYNRCYGANTVTQPLSQNIQMGCWPQNP